MPNIKEILKSMPNTMDVFEESAFGFVTRLTKIDPIFVEHKALLKKYLDDNASQVQHPYLKFGKAECGRTNNNS
jgi:hypothetical protein